MIYALQLNLQVQLLIFYHLKVKGDGKLSHHLGADYFEDPDGTYVSQPREYIDRLAETYKRLFNEESLKGHKPLLTKTITQK